MALLVCQVPSGPRRCVVLARGVEALDDRGQHGWERGLERPVVDGVLGELLAVEEPGLPAAVDGVGEELPAAEGGCDRLGQLGVPVTGGNGCGRCPVSCHGGILSSRTSTGQWATARPADGWAYRPDAACGRDAVRRGPRRPGVEVPELALALLCLLSQPHQERDVDDHGRPGDCRDDPGRRRAGDEPDGEAHQEEDTVARPGCLAGADGPRGARRGPGSGAVRRTRRDPVAAPSPTGPRGRRRPHPAGGAGRWAGVRRQPAPARGTESPRKARAGRGSCLAPTTVSTGGVPAPG